MTREIVIRRQSGWRLEGAKKTHWLTDWLKEKENEEEKSVRLARILRSIWIITCTTTCQIIQNRDARRPLELTHSWATACVRERSRACVLRVRSHVGIGGQEGAPGVVRGRHVFRGGGDSLQQFYNCPTRWISCPLVGRDSRNTVAFPPTGIESILTPQSALPSPIIAFLRQGRCLLKKKKEKILCAPRFFHYIIFCYNYKANWFRYKCPITECVQRSLQFIRNLILRLWKYIKNSKGIPRK